MRKNFEILFLVLLFPFLIFSRTLSSSEIIKAAKNFLYLHNIETISAHKIKPVQSTLSKKDINFHLLELKPHGFIIFSRNTKLPPILAYSFKNDWKEKGGRFIKQLVNSISDQQSYISPATPLNWNNILNIEAIENIKSNFKQWPRPNTTSTGGWLETTWHQGAPYNDFCPIDPSLNKRSVTGCVATAISQIIHYHRSIGSFQLTPDDRYAKTDSSIKIDQDSSKLDFPSFNKLNEFLKSIKHKYNHHLKLTDQEKAALNFATGILAKMKYSGDNSTAYNNFYKVARRMDYYNSKFRVSGDPLFYNSLINNMMNVLPALLSISNQKVGHILVVDGYNTNGYYHFNYGSGADFPTKINKGWYFLPDTLGLDYNIIDHTYVDIYPDVTDQIKLYTDYKIMKFNPCEIGENSKSESILVQNISQHKIQIDDIAVSENFSLNTNRTTSDHILESKETKYIYVKCIPQRKGKIKGSLLISYTDINEKQYYVRIELKGKGPTHGTVIANNNYPNPWEAKYSPYYIINDLNINGRLKIMPGTEIYINNDKRIKITEEGQLICQGTAIKNIKFTTLSNNRWQGIIFDSSADDDTLAYCNISKIGPQAKHVLEINSSSPVISNCKITENKASRSLILILNSSPIFNKVQISKNNFTHHLINLVNRQNKPAKLQNSLITNNTVENSGSIFHLQNSWIQIINNTISHNLIAANSENLFSLDSSNIIDIKNSILWYNEHTKDPQIFDRVNSDDTIRITYSDLDPKAADIFDIKNNLKNTITAHNIYSDPYFTAPETQNFVLRIGSPCIDKGNPAESYFDIYDPTKPGYAKYPARGRWRNDMGAYGGGRQDILGNLDLLPEQYNFFDNYPNPFNITTTIEFFIPHEDDVEITIYNLNGQKIKTIYNTHTLPGKYKIQWNGRNQQGIKVSNGIYFYRIKTKQFQKTKKLVFLK